MVGVLRFSRLQVLRVQVHQEGHQRGRCSQVQFTKTQRKKVNSADESRKQAMTTAPFVSFVIPTLCRDSLIYTLKSLIEQTAPSWEAIVVIDTANEDGTKDYAQEEIILSGIETLNDKRIRVVWPRPGVFHSAGTMRNEGLRHVSGQWIGFVDDDDAVTPQYVEHLAEHVVDHPKADVVIFRMNDPRLGILPHLEHPRIRLGQVGISFAVKAKSRENVLFVKEDRNIAFHEDWRFIEEMRNMDSEIFISPHVDYVVRPNS